MNEKNEQNHQAEQLKQIFEELQQNAAESEHLSSDKSGIDTIPKIDVLNLPPRKEVHEKNNSRTRLSISRPFFRLLTVIILIIGIIFGAYFIWGDELITIIKDLT